MVNEGTVRTLGSCICRAVRFEIHGPMRDIIACHCRECRRMSGHFTAATAVRPEHLTMLCDDALQWYRTSSSAQRGFCARCGCSLFWKPDSGDRVSVYMGCLDEPGDARLAAHIFLSEKGDYYDIRADGDVELFTGTGGRLSLQ